MRKIIAAAALVMAVLFGCKNRDDVLATYGLGRITRGDLHARLPKNIKEAFCNKCVNPVLQKKQKQVELLRQMMMERILVAEAKRAGLENERNYLLRARYLAAPRLAEFIFRTDILPGLKPEPVVRISEIALSGPDAVNRARSIIAQLDAGANFEELAKTHSRSYSVYARADRGYAVRSMLEPRYADAAFALVAGTYTPAPVAIGGTWYIIKVVDRKTISAESFDAIGDLTKDNDSAQKIRESIRRNLTISYRANLVKERAAIFWGDRISGSARDAVIAMINGAVVLRSGDIDEVYALFSREAPDRGPVPSREKIAQALFEYELLQTVIVKKGYDKNPEFIKQVQDAVDDELARVFLARVIAPEIAVSEADIRSEYELNKKKLYYRVVQKEAGRFDEEPLPLAQVHERIRGAISAKKQKAFMDAITDMLLKRYEAKIDESRLEGK